MSDRPSDNDIELLVEQSLGGVGAKLDNAILKGRPKSFEAMVALFAEFESLEQMKRWAGMSEHPVAIRRRMLFSGQWKANRFVWWTARDDAARKKGDADVAAWKALTEQFPPKHEGIGVPSVKSIVEVYERAEKDRPKISAADIARLAEFDDAKSDPLADAEWVYANLHDPNAIQRAPSRGAANLLLRAQADPKEFWGNIWPNSIKEIQKRRDVGSKKIGKREQRDINVIYDMLRAAVKASEQIA